MADSYEINLEIQGGEQPALVMETEGGATDGASARNAEAWANGTRNGVPVEEGDPAYNKSSKYYRDSAAAIAAGDVIDDDAGHGDTMLAWSADKLVGEFGGKAPAIVVSDTTAEAVKTFSDGADGMPMGVTVGIEPVQDLHGQENPYPGGAGKNMFDMDGTYQAGKYVDANGEIKDSNPSSIQNLYNQKIAVTAGADYTVSGSSSANAIIRIVEYTSGDVFVKRTLTSSVTNPYKTITIDSTTAYIIINPDDTITNIQVESGSSKTDFAPYSNVCPISGWDECNVSRTGKNLLAPWVTTKTYRGVTWTVNDDGTFTATGTADNLASQIITPDFMLPAGEYVLNGCPAGGSATTYYLRVLLYKGSTIISSATDTGDGAEFTVTGEETKIVVFASVAANTSAPSGAWSPMIRLASVEDTTYEQYQCETYQITFPEAAGTVYGATLTVNADGTGTLVVDRAKETYDENSGLSYSAGSQGYPSYFTKKVSSNYSRIITCNTFQKAFINWDNYNNGIRLTNSYFRVRFTPLFDTLEEFNAWIASNNIEVLYELTTPQVYTISAPQVETLKGMNNLWADTGDIKAVDYPADTKLYIDGKIAEIQALILENISNS